MTKTITEREWEALSAYLDKELPVKEVSWLETRLRTQPELKEALEDLRKTRALLRSQPKLRAPRNFTLTPEMVGQRARRPDVRSWWNAFTALRLTSALATVMLVLVLLGDLFSGAPAGLQTAQSPASETTIMMEAPEEAAKAPGEVGQEESAAAPGAPPEMSLMQAPTENAAEPEAGGSEAGGSEAGARLAPEGTAAPAAEGESMDTFMAPEDGISEAEATPVFGDEPDSGITGEFAPPTAPAIAELPAPSASEAREDYTAPAPVEQPGVLITSRPTLRAMEIGLAVIALLAGAAAILLHRSRSS